jgi:hypothetical protein
MSDIAPQFGKAEYANVPGAEKCSLCRSRLGLSFYRVNGSATCVSCGRRAETGIVPVNNTHYPKALLFGAAAAFAGFILYSTVTILTGFQIGYMSLAVGFLVGVAMKKGAAGEGGRKYQITAAILTYAAVSMAAIPIYIYYAKDKIKADVAVHQQAAKPAPATSSSDSDYHFAGDPETVKPASKAATAPAKPSAVSLFAGLGVLAAIGLASPFLELASSPGSGIIGLVILWVGISFAWRQTAAKALSVEGPFENAPKTAAATAG